jgi:hypothetical protein
MARKEAWTSISVKKTQFNIIDQIHKDTRLDKHDIVELALMEKYPEYFPEEAKA